MACLQTLNTLKIIPNSDKNPSLISPYLVDGYARIVHFVGMAKIIERMNNGKMAFCVELGTVDGKRRRRWAKSRRQATGILRDFQDEQKSMGVDWLGLESRTKWSTLSILQEIKQSGVTLQEVWDAYQKNHFTNADKTIEDAVKELLAVKGEAGRRSRYTEELDRVLKRFAQGRQKRRIASITAEELRSWLVGLDASQSTKKTVQTRLNTFFGWAYRQGYTKDNPCEKLEKIRLDEGDPEILTVTECKQLVSAANQHDPDFLPYLALALFQGIRPEECKRLKVEDIDLKRKQITVSGKAAKTRDRRIVPLQAPALAILEKCLQKTWFNFQTNFRRRRDAVRKLAGLTEWPKDVLRHTAASHFYNLYGMDEATKALGHSAAIMLRHYRAMQSKEESEEWLKIGKNL